MVRNKDKNGAAASPAPLCRPGLLPPLPAPARALPRGCRPAPAPPGSQLSLPPGGLEPLPPSSRSPLPGARRAVPHTLSLSPGCWAALCPFSPRLSPRRPPVAAGLGRALRWGRWSRREPAGAALSVPAQFVRAVRASRCSQGLDASELTMPAASSQFLSFSTAYSIPQSPADSQRFNSCSCPLFLLVKKLLPSQK